VPARVLKIKHGDIPFFERKLEHAFILQQRLAGVVVEPFEVSSR
jgi:hypothetical protein